MPRGGSKPGERRGGRPKGGLNKFTVSAKAAFQYAYQAIGGDEALATWARENESDFYKLFARLIPTEVTGPDGGALQTVTRIVHEHQAAVVPPLPDGPEPAAILPPVPSEP